MRRLRRDPRGLVLSVLVVLGIAMPAAAQPPAAGGWATYEWRNAARVDVPVLVQQPGASGAGSWTVEREASTPRPIFVTYSIVRADGKPLSITQVTVDSASGKAVKSVTKDKKGVAATPENGLRPLQEAGLQGTREEVAVPAGRFTAVKAPHRNGTVWVSDRVPGIGVVKGAFPEGQLELIKSGTGGAQDLLRS
jgi:hypothetical protein